MALGGALGSNCLATTERTDGGEGESLAAWALVEGLLDANEPFHSIPFHAMPCDAMPCYATDRHPRCQCNASRPEAIFFLALSSSSASIIIPGNHHTPSFFPLGHDAVSLPLETPTLSSAFHRPGASPASRPAPFGLLLSSLPTVSCRRIRHDRPLWPVNRGPSSGALCIECTSMQPSRGEPFECSILDSPFPFSVLLWLSS